MTVSELRHAGLPSPSSLTLRVGPRIRRLAAFGAVGGLAFIVDVGVFNLLRSTVMPDQVIVAKVISIVVATVVAWIGHRYLTFRAERGARVGRELALFGLANLGGLVIATGCLGVSHYLLGLTSSFADNVSGNVVGLVLATAFRFFAYRVLVFRAPATSAG